MDAKTFNKIVEEQLDRSASVLLTKADEYATDGDRLHNFKQAAHLGKTNLREALRGMMIKHTVSIYDMTDGPQGYPIEVWNEKITDHINYLLLLRAVVEEEEGAVVPKIHSDKELADLRDKLSGEIPTSVTTVPPVTAGPVQGTPQSPATPKP